MQERRPIPKSTKAAMATLLSPPKGCSAPGPLHAFIDVQFVLTKLGKVWVLFLVYRHENGGSERASYLCAVTQPINISVTFGFMSSWLQRPCPPHHTCVTARMGLYPAVVAAWEKCARRRPLWPRGLEKSLHRRQDLKSLDWISQ